MKLPLFIAAGAAAILAACATPATGVDAQSRFDTFDISATSVDWSSYDEVYVAPVTASAELRELIGYRPLGANDRKRTIGADDLNDKLSDLADDVRRELADVVTLVDEPGAGVLTVAIEVTRLESNRPTQAEMAIRPGLSIRSIYSGSGGATVTFIDGSTEIATAMDAYTPVLDDVTPAAGVWSTFDRFSGRLADKIAGLFG